MRPNHPKPGIIFNNIDSIMIKKESNTNINKLMIYMILIIVIALYMHI
jgi:hypothetical protein